MLRAKISSIFGFIILNQFHSLFFSTGYAAQLPQCQENPITLEMLNRVDSPELYRSEDFTKWHFTQNPSPKGVAIVHHGLNLKPSKMNQVVGILNELGIDVLNVGLFGHRGNTDEMKNVTHERWISDSYHTYCLASKHAQSKNLPLYFVGFSIGALIYESMMSNTTHYNLGTPVVFQKAVLFAPAVALTFKTQLLRLITFLPNSTIIPSMSNEDYRANSGTSIGAYEVLFKTKSEMLESQLKQSNIPTLVFLDPEDSLIDQKELEEIKKTNSLSQWSIAFVNTDEGPLEKTYHHLIVVEEALGKNQWKRVTEAIKTHLQ